VASVPARGCSRSRTPCRPRQRVGSSKHGDPRPPPRKARAQPGRGRRGARHRPQHVQAPRASAPAARRDRQLGAVPRDGDPAVAREGGARARVRSASCSSSACPTALRRYTGWSGGGGVVLLPGVASWSDGSPPRVERSGTHRVFDVARRCLRLSRIAIAVGLHTGAAFRASAFARRGTADRHGHHGDGLWSAGDRRRLRGAPHGCGANGPRADFAGMPNSVPEIRSSRMTSRVEKKCNRSRAAMTT
jgi:hypothetical protein